MVRTAVSLPPVFSAVTVYEADEVTAVGVPLIAPVDESKDNPAGSDGETDHDVIVPPLALGVTAVIALSFVSVNEFGLYVSDDGATSLTMIVTDAVSLPPVFVPVIV